MRVLTNMTVRRSALSKLMQRFHVSPDQRRLELGKVSVLLQPPVPYCRHQVCCQQRQGDNQELCEHGRLKFAVAFRELCTEPLKMAKGFS